MAAAVSTPPEAPKQSKKKVNGVPERPKRKKRSKGSGSRPGAKGKYDGVKLELLQDGLPDFLRCTKTKKYVHFWTTFFADWWSKFPPPEDLDTTPGPTTDARTKRKALSPLERYKAVEEKVSRRWLLHLAFCSPTHFFYSL